MAVLVIGGAGYIGSHTTVELLEEGKEVVVIDNFYNSNPKVLEKIKEITGKDFKFYEMNYLDKQALEKVFNKNEIDAVINFAGYKAVGESVEKPLDYYINNVSGCLGLLDVMKKHNVKKFIFSSTATVYGTPRKNPITENFAVGKTESPYATTKYFIERILQDVYKSDNSWNICILRYFNPVGAHESGKIGEEPNGMPNNLMPRIVRAAAGKMKELSVFGNDYDTPDGTCIRDYIHVVDLAKGHVKALEKLDKEKSGVYIYNLGTGTGYSVLELIHTFEKTTGKKVPYKITERRLGDIARYYANPEKAEKELGWKAEKTLEDMCKDSWRYIEETEKETKSKKTDLVEVKNRSLVDGRKVYLTFKRASDVVISSIALIVLMPLLALVGALIKIDSKGPVLLKQERIGKDGKIFKMYKFRSMVIGKDSVFADDILENYLKENEEARKEYQTYKKLKDDPRVTKVGKFIRKTSIDELPQLINVFIGNMSLVGPRPYMPREKADMKDYYEYIIQSKPGITGMWQISGRNDTSFEKRLNIDYTYNQAKGIVFDTKLLVKTFLKVVKKEGAR